MMQLLPEIKASLDPKFLRWYSREFASTRNCYVHWSASYRHQNWPDYHKVITETDGVICVHTNNRIDQDLFHHTFQRNANSWAICVASMYQGNTANLGAHAPTPAQIRRLVSEIARDCIALRVPVGRILTHAEAADNLDGRQGLDFYGPSHGCERWDFFVGIDPQTLALCPPREHLPHGGLPFGDWLRGAVIREIQWSTESRWSR